MWTLSWGVQRREDSRCRACTRAENLASSTSILFLLSYHLMRRSLRIRGHGLVRASSGPPGPRFLFGSLVFGTYNAIFKAVLILYILTAVYANVVRKNGRRTLSMGPKVMVTPAGTYTARFLKVEKAHRRSRRVLWPRNAGEARLRYECGERGASKSHRDSSCNVRDYELSSTRQKYYTPPSISARALLAACVSFCFLPYIFYISPL